ncbi:superoxide dismutase family protein [Mycolicibacterium sp. S2-37]|uniref:superoxide dismutase[Cu-Zn] n=1 Tax=Mycolicibacterium sp. S2-37 TaxID=2810297 RepID=UPI001A93BA42|nr:superoxide dismutase family protein [Mycolicibacterium sp. S2-37]MBO0681451.1 superoxide dismutase family protein [Mycolicibacterium sp. S2-37]
MLKPGLKPAAVAALFAAPAFALTACTPNEPISSEPGTTPSVWTGSPAPTSEAGEGGAGGHGQGGHSASGEKLTAELKSPDGTTVATADFDFSGGYATITVQTVASGQLEPGFHGMHIHSVGKCEANSTPPTGGAPGNFLSAGGHFNVPGKTGHPASGDLIPLQVREDGSAMVVTTTDAFTAEQLMAGQRTAIMIHANADNFANIPPERYNQVNGTPGPDQETMATGDAGGRVACGVIGPAE